MNWIFFPGVDSMGEDLEYTSPDTIEKLLDKAGKHPLCVAFNSLGFLKRKVIFPLAPSPFFREKDGIFIRASLMENGIQCERNLSDLIVSDDESKSDEDDDYETIDTSKISSGIR
jgi:hypothetical protein